MWESIPSFPGKMPHLSQACVQAKLIASLRSMVGSQLSRLGWPPPLADSQGTPQGGRGSSQGARGAPMPWTALDQEPLPAAAQALMKLLEALTQLQRAVQRSSFDVVRAGPRWYLMQLLCRLWVALSFWTHRGCKCIAVLGEADGDLHWG